MGLKIGNSTLALVIAPIIIVVAGCGQVIWVKPNGTQDELSRVRYLCLQQAQQREAQSRSAGNAQGAYRSASIDTTVTNDTLYNACMNSHGWYSKYVSEPSAQAQSNALASPQNAARSAPPATKEVTPSATPVMPKTNTKAVTNKKSAEQSKPPSATDKSSSSTTPPSATDRSSRSTIIE